MFNLNPQLSGWMLLAQFIFTLAMALKCYPLLPGGLLVIQAILIGMTSTEHVYTEVLAHIDVILLLVFMVAGIYFMQDLLYAAFCKLILIVDRKEYLSVLILLTAAFLSAFLDALTVMAVIITVSYSFYAIYQNASDKITEDEAKEFRGFLRNILLHAGIGTALGGVFTMVGEPQNLIIASKMEWGFLEFAMNMIHVSATTLVAGVIVCYSVEKFKLRSFGFGYEIPLSAKTLIKAQDKKEWEEGGSEYKIKLITQGLVGALLITALSLHLAPVGLIGLAVIILTTSLNGVNKEHSIGKAFQDALPFTCLLVIFFAVVAVIVDQKLFQPIMNLAMTYEGNEQLSFFYIANAALSVISDNVFVGTIYINEVRSLFDQGLISREHMETLAVAVNTGTNLPSVATPNGQAAFLFLLTSKIAILINLSYGRMMLMAAPYAVVLSVVGYFCVMA